MTSPPGPPPGTPPASSPTVTDPSPHTTSPAETNRPIHNPWQQVRELWVNQALENDDLDALRRISALPGGFGGLRKKVWPVLLRVHANEPDNIGKPANANEEATPAATNLGKPANASEEAPPAATDEAKPDQAEGVTPSDRPSPSSRADTGGPEPLSDGPEAGPSLPSSPVPLPPHQDENQVHLDTKRSFVTYPRGLTPDNKLAMQADLDDLIVGVLRKYPKLSYFQGYHDILSVLYLTFIPPKPPGPPWRRVKSRGAASRASRSRSRPAGERQVRPEEDEVGDEGEGGEGRGREGGRGERRREGEGGGEGEGGSRVAQPKEETLKDALADYPPIPEDSRDTPEWQELRRCAEAVSLYRVRDAMGSGMEGMMGLLRILKNLLRTADPSLAHFASSISPIPSLPFFALSWVLTLFSHDCDELEPVQRVFDWMLGRNPVAGAYLAAAILMAKKSQMLRIAKSLGTEYAEDPSLLHPLFTRLPPLYPDTPAAPFPLPSSAAHAGSPSPRNQREENEANPYDPLPLSRVFALADELMERFPWDGDAVQGRKIMGEGSVVLTYEREVRAGTAEGALGMVDVDVVLPGAGMPSPSDDEDEDAQVGKRHPPRSKLLRPLSLRLPRNRLGTALALGVLLVGVGIAVYGVKAGGGGGGGTGWRRWWGAVARGWAGKEGRKVWAGLRDVL